LIASFSILATNAKSLSPKRIKTLTIGFEDKKYNEPKFAKDIASHIKSDHHEYIFKIEDVLELMEDIDEFFDEPFGDPICTSHNASI